MKFTYLNYMSDLYGYSIGSTIKALKLFQSLEQQGHKVFFHWLGENQGKETSGTARRQRYPSIVRDLLFTPKQLFLNIIQLCRERQIIKRDNPDAIIVRLDAFRISATWLARLYHLPLLVEADGASSYEWLTFNNGRHIWDSVLLWCEKVILARSDGIFAQSRIAKDYYVKTHGIDAGRIAVITNGADIKQGANAKLLETLLAKLGIAKSAQVIGFIGSMQQWHGVQDVQNLVRDILNEFKNAVFLFVGSGGALEQEFKKNLNDCRDRVIFTGSVPNEQASDYIQLFTIALAPYPPIDLFYFSPIKMFEYMSAGVPIVASKSGQISEILQDGESAMLYDPGDIPQMKSAICRLLQDGDLAHKIGRNAQQLLEKNHTWQQKAKELDNYIQKCLQKHVKAKEKQYENQSITTR